MAAGANATYRVTKALGENAYTVKELTEKLNLSAVTIRLVIKELEKENKINRSPGHPAHYTLAKDEDKIDPTANEFDKELLSDIYKEMFVRPHNSVNPDNLALRKFIEYQDLEKAVTFTRHLAEAVRIRNEQLTGVEARTS